MARKLMHMRQHLWLAAGVVLLLVPLVSLLTSEEAKAGPPTTSATVLATVRINTLEVTVSAPASVTTDTPFRVTAAVKNIGSTKIMGAKATIHLPVLGTSTAFTLRGQEDKNLGVISPGKDKNAKWNLVAKAKGNYFIMVTASGTEEVSGDLLVSQDTTLIIEVKDSGTGPGKADVQSVVTSILDALRRVAFFR